MEVEQRILGFCHYRTDLGDGTRTGVVFAGCHGNCHNICTPKFLPLTRPFAEDTPERDCYTVTELTQYLREEKVLCYTKRLGVTLMGREPLIASQFCLELARRLQKEEMDINVWTCGAVSTQVYRDMKKYCSLFVYRYLTPFSEKIDPCPLYPRSYALEMLSFLDEENFPYRVLVPVVKGMNEKDSAPIAQALSSLKHVKSVVLDFSASDLSAEEQLQYRKDFLNHRLILY